jgi:hypothetical protein
MSAQCVISACWTKRMKKAPLYGAAAASLCILSTLIHAWAFSEIASNIPHRDDYYDSLFFLYLFNNASGWQEKIHIIFWQYHEHLMVYTRLINLAYFYITSRIDFFWLSAIGNLQLPAAAILLSSLFNAEARKPRTHVIVPFLILLNPAAWLTLYHSTFSIGGIGLIFLPILLVCLLQKGRLFLAAAVLMLLVSTQANGAIMLPLAAAQVWLSNKFTNKIKYIFLAVTIFISMFFLLVRSSETLLTITPLDEKIRIFLQNPYPAITGFLGLVGSLSFTENNTIILPVISGITILATLSLMALFKSSSQKMDKLPLISLALYFLSSLLACSIIRITKESYSAVYDSHYKIYSLTLFSISMLFLYTYTKSKWGRLIIIYSLSFFLLWCYIVFIPIAKDDSFKRRHAITTWSTLNRKNEEIHWVGYAPQILLMSIKAGYYSPFDSKNGALNQVEKTEKISACAENIGEPLPLARIENREDSIAFLVISAEKNDPLESVMLCSPHFNLLMTAKPGLQKATINKTTLPEGDYAVLLKTGNSTGFAHIGDVHVSGKVPDQECTTPFFPYRIAPQLKNHLCKL